MQMGLALPYNITGSAARLARLAEEAGWDGVFLGDAIWCEDPFIALAAAAGATQRIRLGTMVTAVPLHTPWRLASQSLALDLLSDGRLILGLGTGATWMGWYAFPGEVSDARARSEMLSETIDILTRLYARQPFDYAGQHYRLKLTELDVGYYPPGPVQQPRIPLWVVGVWDKQKSMQRALTGDGVILEVWGADRQPLEPSPEQVRAVKADIEAAGDPQAALDIVLNGSTAGMERSAAEAKLGALAAAGATWWVEGLWAAGVEAAAERIGQGPPLRN